MKIKKFENLESWKKSRKLTNRIYEATGTGRFTRDFGLKDQFDALRSPYCQILRKASNEVETRSSFSFWLWLRGRVARFAHNSTLLWIKSIYRETRLRVCPTTPMKLAV